MERTGSCIIQERGFGFRGFAYGNGHFIAVGDNGTILESGSIVNLAIKHDMVDTRSLTLSLEGPTGLEYTIQSSTDLISWREVTKFTGAQSTKIILEGLPANSNHLFYRAYSQ